MPTVEIDGVEYEVYADIETADAYAAGASHGGCWRGTTDDDDKARDLVTTARLLNRQRWKGEKTDPDQPLAWPRTGTGVDGVVDDEIPQPIIDASIEIAMALRDGVDLQTDANTTNKLSSITAGSVSLSFYHGADTSDQRFPLIIMELLSMYLLSGAIGLSGVATGVDGESVTENDFGLSRGF